MIRLPIGASQRVLDALRNLGRTEDLKFSPDGSRLAIAGYAKNELTIFDVEIDGSRAMLSDFVQVRLPEFKNPHGVAFVGDESLIVTSRGGGVSVLRLPRSGTEAEVLLNVSSDPQGWIYSPGSVAVARIAADLHAVLICNNYHHTVTRHLLDTRDGYRCIRSERLLGRGLKIPDGVAFSPDSRWIAVSNHDANAVLLYPHDSRTTITSQAEGVLKGIRYPHGVRFTSDGRMVFVADSGAPFVHAYVRSQTTWQGEHDPLISLRVTDDDTFRNGSSGPEEGGPKGIDLHPRTSVLATTHEQQPLAFFDIAELIPSFELESPAAEPLELARQLLLREAAHLDSAVGTIVRLRAEIGGASVHPPRAAEL